jgi:hypothetical protein
MTTWTIFIENAPNTYTPTGETFEGTMDEVNARLEELRDATGKCHGAQAVQQ